MEDPELAAIRAKKLRDLMVAAAPKPPPPEWSGPVVVTDLTFDSEVRQPGLILVDFWAEWCGPCHRVAPILEQVTRARASRMRLGKLNIDENPRTPTRFRVTSIPTMILFKNGKLVDGLVGALPREQIETVVDRWI
ncbi:MAG TPA: thioredoxin [Thermoplasmata archaeon]|nr:thioredoxin [Thermoplasmata archaeon]